VKALYFTSPSTPPGKANLVVQDDQGWLYVKGWFDKEEPATPFFSVEELDLAFEEKLTLVREVEIPR
jgi:hypothetical protein